VFNTDQLHLFDYKISASPYAYNFPALGEFQKNEVQAYLWHYINVSSPATGIFRTKFPVYLSSLNGHCTSIVHLHKLNNLLRINDFLRDINHKLPVHGLFACCIETLEQRNKRIFGENRSTLNKLNYGTDFIINRVFPKLLVTKKLYFAFTKGHNRVISLPEMLGRLIYCGFRIIDFKKIDNLTYFITEKENEPLQNLKPTYGLFVNLKRIGREGKIINVYKFRTMFPYSEFIQKLVYENNNLKPGGKFQNDFRITGWGKFMRRYWIDELPMILNVFKGELKLVGLRPLSQQYLSLYNPEIQNKRYKIKPGLIPPYYYDMPKTLTEIMKSEEKYIDAYARHPFTTDVKYLVIAFRNIVLKGARSS